MNWVVVWIPVFLVAAFLTFYSFFEWNPFTRSRKPLLERDEVSSSAERSDDLLQTGGPSPLIPLEPRPPSDIEEVLPEFYTLSESHLGLVYEGTLNGSRVRVRRIGTPPGGDSRNVKHIFNQFAVSSKRLAHQNIVSLLDVTFEPLELISDWMPDEDLPGYITRHPNANRLSLLSDVAEGLNYLHSRNVIHGDLNGSNVLVDATGHARITNFGLTVLFRDIDSTQGTPARFHHSSQWIAPEILYGLGTYSKEADVFSFAGVAIEVITGAAPFSGISPHAAMLAIKRGRRPPRPIHPSLTEESWALIRQCWDKDDHLRPDALRISCRFGTPAWKRLIDHRPLASSERISLIANIFSDHKEMEIVKKLHGDDAQSFVDVTDEMLENLEPQLREKSLSALCKICGHQALLPKSIQIPLCYDRSADAPLYSGGYADVWKGEHKGSTVAVKVLRIYATADLDKIMGGFCKEVITWKSLNHPNVLSLWGVIMNGKDLAMVSEWMSNGSINEFISAHRDVNRYTLLGGVAEGLIYLHSQGMVHGDLKGANIMVDQRGKARLADFGLLTFISDPTNATNSSSFLPAGTTRWMSPELLHPELLGFNGSRPTKSSDTYALGMVIFEVLSGESPFSNDKNVIVMRKIIEGVRPERPQVVWFTDGLWGTLEKCWSHQPKDRPTVETVLERLMQVSDTWQPLPFITGR